MWTWTIVLYFWFFFFFFLFILCNMSSYRAASYSFFSHSVFTSDCKTFKHTTLLSPQPEKLIKVENFIRYLFLMRSNEPNSVSHDSCLTSTNFILISFVNGQPVFSITVMLMLILITETTNRYYSFYGRHFWKTNWFFLILKTIIKLIDRFCLLKYSRISMYLTWHSLLVSDVKTVYKFFKLRYLSFHSKIKFIPILHVFS